MEMLWHGNGVSALGLGRASGMGFLVVVFEGETLEHARWSVVVLVEMQGCAELGRHGEAASEAADGRAHSRCPIRVKDAF